MKDLVHQGGTLGIESTIVYQDLQKILYLIKGGTRDLQQDIEDQDLQGIAVRKNRKKKKYTRISKSAKKF